MKQIELEANSREILGKKVRRLRRQGITPVHLFGHSVESVALQCDTARLQRTLARAGKTRIISLKLEKAKRPRNVLVREVQIDPCTSELLHVDFYQVRATEKIRVEVPIVLVGEAPALNFKENMLMRELDSLTVECLADKIPTSIELDLSSLTEVEQTIRVKDIVLGEEVKISHDLESVVAKITSKPVLKVEEEEVAVEEAVEAPEAPEAAPSPVEESPES